MRFLAVALLALTVLPPRARTESPTLFQTVCAGVTNANACAAGGGGGVTSGTTTTSGCTDFSVLTSRAGVIDCTTSVTIADGATGTATFAGPLRASSGSAVAPGYSWSADIDTGFWLGTNAMVIAFAGGSTGVLPGDTNFAGFQTRSDYQYLWSSTTDATGVKDTGLERLAAGVIGTTNGGTGTGWLQQESGELALAADYTNLTAVMSATALSATLVSGRTYSFTAALFFSNSIAADGFLLDFNGGTAAVTNFRAHCSANNAAGAALAFTNAASVLLDTDMDVTLALTTQALMTCQGTFVPSGAGTFILRASEKVDGGGTLTIYRGSWLNIRDANPL